LSTSYTAPDINTSVRILITAGPTREQIDDIRYISNPSSGKMGAAIAGAALARGWQATVIAGPCQTAFPESTETIDVTSSGEMTDTVLSELSTGYDLLISAAALADFTPARRVDGKIRSGPCMTLELVPTRKLIDEARKAFPGIMIIAFKAEHGGSEDEMLASARRLLATADLVVLNDVSKGVFSSDENEVWLVSKDIRKLPRMAKDEIAKAILDAAEAIRVSASA